MTKHGTFEVELGALKSVLEALEPLEDAQRQFVLETAISRLGTPVQLGVGEGTGSEKPGNRGGQDPHVSPKEFIKKKKPQTELQRVVCLAYFITNYREIPHFNTADITNLNTEAACKQLSNPSSTLNNATSQSDLLATAGEGKKQITPLGEAVVEALPDQEAVKAALKEHGKRPRRPTRKGAKRKKTAKR